MKRIKVLAVAVSMVMLLTVLPSCSSVKKSANVVKEDDPWYESTRFMLYPDVPDNTDMGTTQSFCTSDDKIFHLYSYTANHWQTQRTVIDAYDLDGKLISRHDVICEDDYKIHSIFSASASPDGKTLTATAHIISETAPAYQAFVTIDAESGAVTDMKEVFGGEAKKLTAGEFSVSYLSIIGNYTVALMAGEYHGGMDQEWKLGLFKDTELVTECDMSSLHIGMILDGFSLDEHSGSLYLVGYETGDVVSAEFDIYNGALKSKTSMTNFNRDEVNFGEYTSTNDGDLCKIDSLGNIIKMDINTMTPTTMVDTNWYTPYFYPAPSENVSTNSKVLSSNENRTIILDDESVLYGSVNYINYTYIRVLKKADKNPHAGKQVIEIALPQDAGVSDYLARSIYEFNKTDSEYLIRAWDKHKTGFAVGRTFGNVTEDEQQVFKMIQELKGADAPDLAVGIQKNYAMRDDVFKDLTGFLNPEVLDRQYTNIIEAGRINGKLYFLPVTLEIEGLVTRAELLEDGAVGITFEEYDALVEGPLHGFEAYDYPESNYYNKQAFLLSCIDTKSAIEGDTINFDTEQFRAAVEHSNNFEYDDLNSMPQEYLYDMTRFRGECYYTKINDYLDYVYACCRPTGRYNIIGTPSVDASGPRFKALETISVSVSTDVEEGCKRFVNYLFAGSAVKAEDCMFRQIVTNKDIMDMSIERLTKINNDLYEAYQENIKNGTFIPAAGLDKTSGNKAATEEMRESFTESLSTISTYYYEDSTIIKFTLEELAPYYAGDRSLDDAIKYLNDRTEKYIREM